MRVGPRIPHHRVPWSDGVKERNLYDLRPVRSVPWESAGDGNVVLRAPKFRARLMVRFLVPRLKRPDVAVHLDETGSAVWRACDGKTTVLEVAGTVYAQLGGDRDALDARVAEFIRRLDREGLMRLEAGEF
jgi:hypothetical protein